MLSTVPVWNRTKNGLFKSLLVTIGLVILIMRSSLLDRYVVETPALC